MNVGTADGRCIPDATNSFKFDAANRLIEIDYPGSGNKSVFTYDGLSRNVMIQEYVSSSLTSTKQFVWCGNDRCEQRNAGSTITAQFFSLGETISGTSYFYTSDCQSSGVNPGDFFQLTLMTAHPTGFNPLGDGGSVREMTNSSGVIQAQYSYDAFGRASLVQGSLASDVQYAGYYCHARSGLCLTMYRAFSPFLGRWINRDPMEEEESFNLYSYVDNDPIDFVDFDGLRKGVKGTRGGATCPAPAPKAPAPKAPAPAKPVIVDGVTIPPGYNGPIKAECTRHGEPGEGCGWHAPGAPACNKCNGQ